MEWHQQRSEKSGLFKSNERKSIQSASIESGQNVVRGGGKVSSMTVKSGKGVMKLNKPLKMSKDMQRDAKRRKDTKNDVTEREGTERSGHHSTLQTLRFVMNSPANPLHPGASSPSHSLPHITQRDLKETMISLCFSKDSRHAPSHRTGVRVVHSGPHSAPLDLLVIGFWRKCFGFQRF